MSMRLLLDTLAEFIREDLKEIQLPAKQDVWTEDPRERAIEVYKQRMPSAEDAEERVPYILLQLLNGEDKEEDSHVSVRGIIVVFDWSPEQGQLTLINIIEKLRFDLQKAGVVGRRFELQKPLEWVIYPDDTLPYHIAELSTVWSIPAVDRDLEYLHRW